MEPILKNNSVIQLTFLYRKHRMISGFPRYVMLVSAILVTTLVVLT